MTRVRFSLSCQSLIILSAAGEISFSDKMSRLVLQSEESVTIKVRRVDIVEGDIIVPWRIQSHNLGKNDDHRTFH